MVRRARASRHRRTASGSHERKPMLCELSGTATSARAECRALADKHIRQALLVRVNVTARIMAPAQDAFGSPFSSSAHPSKPSS